MASIRIVFIGDLHYPRDTTRLVQTVDKADPDILVFNGDFLDTPTEKSLTKFLRLLKRFKLRETLFTLGNHEHYLTRNKLRKHWSSLDQARIVAEKLEAEGHRVLDYTDGYVYGNIYIAGNVGWYDYTLAPREYTSSDYENCNPYGATLTDLYLCDIKHRYDKCPPWWRRDCLYIRLPIPHSEYVEENTGKLDRQLGQHEDKTAIVVYHHAPRKELLDHTASKDRQFDYAYAGSTRLDNPIRNHSNVKLVAYGHLHSRTPRRITEIQGVTYVNTYPYHKKEPGLTLVQADTVNGNLEVKIIEL